MSEMKLKSPGSDAAVAVDVQRCAEGDRSDYRLQIGDASVEVDVIESRGGQAVLRIHGRIVPVCVLRSGNHLEVWVAGRTHQLEIVERVAKRSGGTQATSVIQASLTAPMPGTILQINIAPGDTFAAHQPLIVMESMKMEMTLSAPHDGAIKEVLCRPGQLVEMGALLAKFADAANYDALA